MLEKVGMTQDPADTGGSHPGTHFPYTALQQVRLCSFKPTTSDARDSSPCTHLCAVLRSSSSGLSLRCFSWRPSTFSFCTDSQVTTFWSRASGRSLSAGGVQAQNTTGLAW